MPFAPGDCGLVGAGAAVRLPLCQPHAGACPSHSLRWLLTQLALLPTQHAMGPRPAEAAQPCGTGYSSTQAAALKADGSHCVLQLVAAALQALANMCKLEDVRAHVQQAAKVGAAPPAPCQLQPLLYCRQAGAKLSHGGCCSWISCLQC